ncbi:MAG: hypothetical protein GY828_02605 [Candidatus Gracilibacteria bacterium]|nr:hypothetical protein [Candidatus Gracilibacteria bacterium]
MNKLAITIIIFLIIAIILKYFIFDSQNVKQDILSKQEFQNYYLDKVRNQIQYKSIENTELLTFKIEFENGAIHYPHLHNIYTQYINKDDTLDNIINHAILSISDSIDQKKGIILPVVKDIEYLDEISKQINNLGDGKFSLVTMKLNEKLIILFALDDESGLSYIGESYLKENNLSTEDIKDEAYKNLFQKYGNFNFNPFKEYPGLYTIETDGTYETSLISHNANWDNEVKIEDNSIYKHLGIKGDLLFMIPARGALFITDSNEIESIKKMQDLSNILYNQDPYRISNDIFYWEKGVLKEYINKH